MEDTLPLTRLQAVNEILRTIGQSGVSTLLTVDANPDSENASETLTVVLKELLSEGWHFNTEKNYPIDPNEAGEIVLPVNCLRIDSAWKSKNMDLARRGQRLYDRVKHTYNIGQTVYVDMVVGLEFEDLSPAARWYATVKAARRFATKELSSSVAMKFTQEDEAAARLRLEQEESENDDRTMAQASPHVARMRRGQRGAG